MVHEAAAQGFERGADDYERARPGYPRQAVDAIVRRLGIGAGSTVLDLAAGTGKLTRELVPTGARLVAVEPVDAMRRKLADVLPDVEVRAGVAEELPLEDASVDAVVCAQAFHWFDAPRALAELARVLREGGGLAVLWNVRDESVPWVRAFTECLISETGGTPYRRDYSFDRWGEVFAAADAFTDLRLETFRHVQTVDRELVVARAASTSFVSALPEDRRLALLDRVRRLLDEAPELAGRETFDFPHDTDVMWCHRR